MKRIVIIISALASFLNAIGAESNTPNEKGKGMYVWKSVGPLGLTKQASLDTSLCKYHINDMALHRTIGLQSLGNLGTPAISMVFNDRIERSNFIFFNPFSLYYTAPEDVLYFNTKTPYTNISYYNGGLTNRKQEALSGIFAINVNPHLNVGMYGKWQNNYGSYENQATKNYNTGFFGSYINRHHELMSTIQFNGYRNKENGGFENPENITDPKKEGKLEAYNIPTNFGAGVSSKLTNWNAYLNYKYNIGFDKTTNVSEDSSYTEFIPVASIIYTFRNEADNKIYKDDSTLVHNTYSDNGLGRYNHASNDSIHYWEMSHLLGLSLNEEFNTIGKFGVAGYLLFDQKKYGQITNFKLPQKPITDENALDPIWETTTQTKTGLGANISKRKGEHLQFNFNGEYYVDDEKDSQSSFSIGGDIASKFNIGNNTFSIRANATHKRYCPDYLEEHYISNRIQWDNDFDHKTKTHIEGTIGADKIALYKDVDSSFLSKVAPELSLFVKLSETNLKNYVYWGTDAKPHQYGSNIQVTQLTLQEKFKFWYLHFDNELTLQHANANSKILDLPRLCWYSNLYLQTKPLFKSLTLQLGADMRYNTEYFAPAYLPATGLYYAQTAEEFGNYPFYCAYLSMHLKTFRVFVEYSHLNHIWSNKNNYLVTPNYALEPNYIKFGVSVNFAN